MALASLPSILSDKCGLADDQRILVGVSGGPDSLALLHALKHSGWPLLVGHFDHGLRPESASEAEYMQRIAEDWELSFFSQSGNTGAYAREKQLSIEEAARELRYRFLFDLADREGATAVAVAHNADDQAETVLMHLLRGAGIDGLSGMPYRALPNPWSARIPLVRPLLATWRQEVEAYCAKHHLQPLQDASNQDRTFFRNRLRLDLLPILADYNPQAKAHLHQTAALLAADGRLLQQLTAKAWQRCVLDATSDYVQFDRLALLGEPLALQRRVIRRTHRHLRSAAGDLGLPAVEQALALAGEALSSRQDWLDGLFILSEGDHFWIADLAAILPAPWPQIPAQPLHIEAPGRFSLGSGWQLIAEETGDLSPAAANQDGYQAWLDPDRLGPQLVLRRRQPGDRFQPLGMGQGSVKLTDYMINVKLPRRARAAWPLLCRGDEIVWLPGYQIAHAYRLQAEGRQALHLQLTPN